MHCSRQNDCFHIIYKNVGYHYDRLFRVTASSSPDTIQPDTPVRLKPNISIPTRSIKLNQNCPDLILVQGAFY